MRLPGSFALEAHLRDFVASNLSRIPLSNATLRLYKNAGGRSGVEYPTAVGPIEILAVDADGNFYGFELKVERGPDRALRQLARYMGWVKLELAGEKAVTGIIVANSIDRKLRYAATVMGNALLMEYELDFKVRGVAPMSGE
jgi:endonuclease